ncbi:MAG: ribonuclease J [Candidatus Sumerlaeota bacterium]|nr:ribonuclease J [Candidatus Sumerlaeota bacterium]
MNGTREVKETAAPGDSPPAGTLWVTPLGGVGEFGMNMCAYEWGGDILVVDAGVQFPPPELLGVDLVVPDVSHLAERADRIRAILLTHGHEDHIGGLPYVLPHIKAPIYGTALTLGLARERLREFDLENLVELREIRPRDRRRIGAFEVEFISVTHSVPQAVSLAIRTPIGAVVHTGDYRIDPAPIGGEGFDTFALSRCGEEGVLLMLADSTNVEREGRTGSEHDVRATLERIFADAPRQVVMAMFSTAIHRMQVALDAAAKTGRTVFLSGYSVERNFDIARTLGCLRVPPGLVRDDRSVAGVPPEDRLILTTGSQGEALSAMSRMALGSHKHVTVEEGDTIVLSARIIPGNERAIYRMINHFFRLGARVLYERNAAVHVSGHAYREEMRLMLHMVKPRFLMPVHGEMYQLIAHRDLAVAEGIDPSRVHVVEDGQTLELTRDGARLGRRVQAGPALVDGKTVGEVGEVVLRDRKHLSEDGMITVILVIDHSNGEILAGPDLVSRGFVHMDESDELIQKCKDVVLETYAELDTQSREEKEFVQAEVRRALRKFLRKETDRYPVILPVVMEV